jgi:hypothetical protein
MATLSNDTCTFVQKKEPSYLSHRSLEALVKSSPSQFARQEGQGENDKSVTADDGFKYIFRKSILKTRVHYFIVVVCVWGGVGWGVGGISRVVVTRQVKIFPRKNKEKWVVVLIICALICHGRLFLPRVPCARFREFTTHI